MRKTPKNVRIESCLLLTLSPAQVKEGAAQIVPVEAKSACQNVGGTLESLGTVEADESRSISIAGSKDGRPDRTEAMAHHGQTGSINARDLSKHRQRKFQIPHHCLQIPWCP